MSSKNLKKKHVKRIRALANFDFLEKNIKGFTRGNKHSMDCVVNALEFLEKIDTECSKYIRILFENKTIEGECLKKFFQIEMPNHNWVFTHYTNLQSFIKKITDNLGSNKACVCLLETSTGNGHVTLIAKDINGKFALIDGQEDTLKDLSDETFVRRYFTPYNMFATLDTIN